MSRESPSDRLLDGMDATQRRRIAAELRQLSNLEPPGVSEELRLSHVQSAMRQAAERGPLRTVPRRTKLLRPSGNLAWAASAAAVLLIFGGAVWLGGADAEVATEGASVVALDREEQKLSGGLEIQPGSRIRKGGALPAAAAALHVGVFPTAAQWVETESEPTLLELADGSSVHVSSLSRFKREAASDRFTLAHGALSLSVHEREPSKRLIVETDELVATALGTQFSVKRSRVQNLFRSRVELVAGTVWVASKLDGVTRVLSPGDSLSIPPAEPANAAQPDRKLDSNPVSNRGGPGSSVAAAKRNKHAAASPTHIRRQIRAGETARAKQLIHQARVAKRTSAAELALLEAEVLLKDGQRELALRRYVRVFKQFPEARQAELALFAAAQLSGGRRALELTQRYLAHYPSGHFARQADRLLRTLEKKRP